VIVPDVNLLVFAYNQDAPEHAGARDWWEGALDGSRSVGLPWLSILGFVRLMTHRSVAIRPMSPAAALGVVRSWLALPEVSILQPGPRHLDILEESFAALGTAGRMTSDAHLAALAIEYQAELHSNDADFARFPGLRWRNPLKSK
jgi:uncharacterized protein